MGSTYVGPPFADEIGYERHEGSTLPIADGAEHGQDLIMSVCECGWRGTQTFVDDRQGEGQDLADDEWERHHIRPMLREIAEKRVAVGADVLLDLVHGMKQDAKDQYQAADMLAELLDDLPGKPLQQRASHR